MKKTNRRDFLKGALLGTAAAITTPAFANPRKGMSGLEIVKVARSNITGGLPLVDACCHYSPTEPNSISALVKNNANSGIQGNLFFPNKYPRDETLTKNYNEEIAKIAAQNTDSKFVGTICTSAWQPMLDEIKKCKTEYNFSAVIFTFWDSTQIPPMFLHHLVPLLESAAKLNLPVILPITKSYQQEFLKLIDKIKDIPGLTLLLQDYGSFTTWECAKAGKSFGNNHPFYFFTDGSISPDAFKCFKNVFGSDRLLFGSCGNSNYREVIKNVENLSLSKDDFKKTCFQNANKLFGFNVKEWK